MRNVVLKPGYAFYTGFPFPGSIAHKFCGGPTRRATFLVPHYPCHRVASMQIHRFESRRPAPAFDTLSHTAYRYTRAWSTLSFRTFPLFPFSPNDPRETIRFPFCTHGRCRRGSSLYLHNARQNLLKDRAYFKWYYSRDGRILRHGGAKLIEASLIRALAKWSPQNAI